MRIFSFIGCSIFTVLICILGLALLKYAFNIITAMMLGGAVGLIIALIWDKIYIRN